MDKEYSSISKDIAKKALENYELSGELLKDIRQIEQCLGNPLDLVVKKYSFKHNAFAVLYIDGMISIDSLDMTVILPLMNWFKENQSPEDFMKEDFQQHIQTPKNFSTTAVFSNLIDQLLTGNVILLVAGRTYSYIIADQLMQTRSIEEPSSQLMVRGPREGFVETLNINTTLIRRRIMNPALRFMTFKVGEVTKTPVIISYVEGLVDKKALEIVIERIATVKPPEVYESGMLEELIDSNRYSPIPTLTNTERPDVVCSAITEGRIAILMEGTPFALIGPVNFISFFQTAEDYYNRFDMSSFVRIIRFLAFWVAFTLPASYIALTTFHQELIPTDLLISLTAQREGVPFPALLEAFIMETVFEILREAGLRMPRPIGPAVSIVGAIVIGDAAVSAGLVSPAIVIVVSLTAISSFVSPYYSLAGSVRILRFVLMIFAATSGVFGMLIFTIAMCIHLVSLESFGRPFMAPFAPLSISGLKDTLIRFPLWWSSRKKTSGGRNQ
ncbi:spore germination protein [Halobacillus litoralis]|uniref:spore germination protein n=1 Tax=Halobacillus litoralis TaxID=45668 RepID=UPI001CD25254|nr:spore germination protein [Halobacillus litoralis]MCA1021088.1 spore germination protein [Halobacillus litoralis]